MGPIRNLLDRIRERRMERLSSRQGMFPRLRNLINPLDSQGMMDRAQGTQVGGSLSKPMTYDRRVIQDPQADAAQPVATATAAGAGKPAGKAAKPMTAQQQDEAAIQRLAPADPLDPIAEAAHLRRQADVLTARAGVRGLDPTEAMRLNLEARELRAAASRSIAEARQRNFIKADVAEERRIQDERTGLAGATRSMSEMQQAIAQGKTTPLMAASIATKSEYQGREPPPTPAEYQQTYVENLRQFVGPSYARATFATRKGLTPDSPVYGELKTAFQDLPDADRTQALQTYVAPHLLNGYVSEGAAALTKQFGRQPTDDEMGRLQEDGMAWTEGQLAKLTTTLTPPSSRMLPKTRDAIGSVDVHGTADNAFAGVLNLAGQAAQSLAPAAQRFLETFMRPQPSASAAPVAAPMAPPEPTPLQMAPSRPAAPPVARPPSMTHYLPAPPRPVTPSREEMIRKAKEGMSPTYPNGQPKPWAVPQGRK
jgi:hypothetical protein